MNIDPDQIIDKNLQDTLKVSEFYMINFLNKLHNNYKPIEVNNIKIHYINNKEVELFCTKTDQLMRFISYEDKFDNLLFKTTSFIYNYRYNLTNTPLPLNSEHLLSTSFSDYLNLVERLKVGNTFPNYTDHIISITEDIKNLTSSNKNPLFEHIESIFKKGNLYIPSGKNFMIVKNYIEKKSNYQINVISGKHLKTKKNSDKLFIIGYPYWINDKDNHIFMAPKFSSLEALVFNFAGYKIKKNLKLNQTIGKMNIISLPKLEKPTNNSEFKFIYNINPGEAITELNLEYFQNLSKKDLHSKSINDKKCRLVILYGDKFAFLTNEQGVDESQNTLLVGEKNKHIIKKKKIREFLKGDILLLRIGTSQDLIVETANKLMKDTFGEEQSLKIIEMQSQWVNQLNKYIRDQGEDSTIENLKKKGVSQANKGALKRWREGQNMMLLTDTDFKNLLEVIQFGKIAAKEICKNMNELQKFHHKAGKNISKNLKKTISNANLDILLNEGYQEFQLKDSDAKLGLYIIKEISAEDSIMQSSKLDRPLSQDDIDLSERDIDG